MPSILVAGETLVDFLPDSPGPLAEVESFERRAGGAPANVAVALAHLDETPDFWTRIGEDAFGEFLAGTLADHGLPERYVERDPDAKTTLAFVSLGADADREFSFYRDATADTRMEPGRIPEEDLAAFDWIHLDVLSLDAEPARSAVLDLAVRAREAGATVSFDPNARPERWEEFDFAESAAEALSLADVAKATPEDLREVGIEGDPDEAARAVCDRGPHTTLLTLGGEGAFARATAEAPWGEGTVRHGGYEVEPVDTTGAGDAFTAGSIAALSNGESLAEALAFGNAVAATTTTAAGAMTALPTREEVRAFREERDER